MNLFLNLKTINFKRGSINWLNDTKILNLVTDLSYVDGDPFIENNVSELTKLKRLSILNNLCNGYNRYPKNTFSLETLQEVTLYLTIDQILQLKEDILNLLVRNIKVTLYVERGETRDYYNQYYIYNEEDVRAINIFYNQNKCNPLLSMFTYYYDFQLEIPFAPSHKVFMMQAVDKNDSEKICKMVNDMLLYDLSIDCNEAIEDNQEYTLDLRKATTLRKIDINEFGGKLSIPDSIKVISVSNKNATIVTNNAKIEYMKIKRCNAYGLRVEENVLKKVVIGDWGFGFTFVHDGIELKNTLYVDNIDFNTCLSYKPEKLKVFKEGKQIVLKKD
ncbi:hypothetical protein EIN_257970 [Entamoeba invadens IP1]|uniref:Uncharacterized protein n=1 Tax=Entamoeba invadens IP1 TaxID=370355 RepID=A0A0A1TZW3_ENTIV|nr:hypothetical protein EIN_257970 [Entamoeba invadens IP1]ELP84183.1 hypothetical protein EIN_257970 [Entamoeba invadens IP1]|eukprot:XP_004183529.1 hypothetical protein EIN_257970 [Entamoeba invadens IP1]